MNKKNIFVATTGGVILFVLLILITKPALCQIWDFSNTGQIGDTIGGITAPFIGLFGAFLVYVSFRAQNRANKIQFDALSEEKSLNDKNRIYEKHTAIFHEIKVLLQNLEFIIEIERHISQQGKTQPVFISYKGINALNESIIRIEQKGKETTDSSFKESYKTDGIKLNFKYILMAINDLLDSIEKKMQDEEDKDFLKNNIRLFYKGFLNDFAIRITLALNNEKESKEIKLITDNIVNKLNF